MPNWTSSRAMLRTQFKCCRLPHRSTSGLLDSVRFTFAVKRICVWGKGRKRLRNFKRFLLIGYDPFSPLYSLARLGSGRALAAQGEAANARIAYQDFFALWKDADPDIPILKEATAEYAKLQ